MLEINCSYYCFYYYLKFHHFNFSGTQPRVLLCETCTELSCLVDIKPTNVLFEDGVKEDRSEPLHLSPCSQGPEGHLHVGCKKDYTSHDAVVNGMPEQEHIDRE